MVETEDSEQHLCHVRSKALETICGDRVICQRQHQSLDVIESIQSRDNQITRLDNFNRQKTVAANIDHMLIVVAALPEFSSLIVDQYLACASLIRCKASLIVNKAELAYSQSMDVNQISKTYQPLCEQVIFVSAKLGYGLQNLRHLLNDDYAIMVGQSGVGKSSLINRLLNTQQIKVSALSDGIQQGMHTTSHASAYDVGLGKIVDSPGVRSFTPIFAKEDRIVDGFREFADFSGDCKFSNCEHLKEPHCAVKEAVDKGLIMASRYSNYQTLHEQHSCQNSFY